MAKKKKDEKEENVVIEKKYPSLILGLDISTTCIGISIVYDDGVNEPVITDITDTTIPNMSNITNILIGRLLHCSL